MLTDKKTGKELLRQVTPEIYLRIFTFFLCWIWGLNIFAQNIFMRKVNTDKGVQAHDIYSVFQDSKHYLWFCTDAGLWRFDGKKYTAYTTANGLPDNVVFSLMEDKKHRIWLRMYSNKLAYIQNDQITVLPCSNILSRTKKNEVIIAIEMDDQENLYISYLYGESYTVISPPYSEKDVKFYPVSFNTSQYIYETPTGQLITSKSSKEFKSFEFGMTVERNGQKTIVPFKGKYIDSPRITVVRQPDKSYLLGASNILFSYKNHQLKELITFPGGILSAAYDNQRNLWVTVSDRGLYLFRNTDTAFQHPEVYLANAMPNSLLQDNEGSYWITTLKSGIYYAPYNDVNFLNAEKGLSENISFSWHDPASHLVYCFAQGKLFLLDHEHIIKQANININDIEKNEVGDVYELNPNELLCLGRCSFILNKKNLRLTRLLAHIGNVTGNVRSLRGCSYGDTIFCSLQNHLTAFNKRTRGYVRLIYTFNTRINLIDTLPDKRLLVATEDGLNIYDIRKNESTPLEFLPVQTSVKGAVYSKYCKGFIVVMKTGEIYLTDSALTRMTKSIDQIKGNAVRRIYYDKDENLWIATSNGLYLLDKKLHVKDINQENGLPANLLNAITIAENTVYVSSEAGLITFPKGKTFFNDSPPALYYSGTSVNGIYRGMDTCYTLTHNENFIKIAFQAINYRINSEVEYRYRLHGVDHHWKSTRNNVIEYTTLPPGKYYFEMYAINNNGVKSLGKIRLLFTILPPFWNTWWFIAMAGLILSGTITGIFIFRVRQIKKRESEKNELIRKIAETEMQALRSQMNPHFIFNSINSIQHLVLINEPLTANYYLTKFSKLMRNVLEQSRKELMPLSEEIENIKLYLTIESLRFEGKFNYQILIGPETIADNVFVPPMIIQPFIENAIWHGLLLKNGEKQLVIRIFTQDDFLHIEIDDNGIGREEARKYSSGGPKKESLGMKITMERLHLLEKSQQIKTYITIRDKYSAGKDPAGTTAIIQLPIIKNPYDKSSYYR